MNKKLLITLAAFSLMAGSAVAENVGIYCNTTRKPIGTPGKSFTRPSLPFVSGAISRENGGQYTCQEFYLDKAQSGNGWQINKSANGYTLTVDTQFVGFAKNNGMTQNLQTLGSAAPAEATTYQLQLFER